MIFNYAFFSGCIANLGVVPLFSFACFLLDPDFFNLFFLLARVCVVFEDMLYSLSYLINIIYRGIFLSRITQLVKIFLLTTLCISNVYAQKEDIFLSKGEQIEISIGKLQNFSVGNKEVIKYKYLPKKNIILIKGKSLGFSDLVAWKKDKSKIIFHFYVTSKKEQLKKMEIAQVLKNTKLRTKIAGEIIYVSGVIKTLENYLIYKSLEAMNLKSLILNISLGINLKNQIIAKVYKDLYASGFEYINCRELNAQITCEFNTQTDPKRIIHKLQKVFHINFLNLNSLKISNNYKLLFKIVSIENDQLELRDSGFHNIEGELKSLISNNQFTTKTHNIFIENQNYQAKLIAMPEVTTIIDSKFKLELGGEVPISNKKEEESIVWKFIGLQIKGGLSLQGDKFLLKYQSRITKGANGAIEGPRGDSGIFIPKDNYIKLYSINVKSLSSQETGIPFLNKIPIIKNLFTSHNKGNSHKKIIVYVKLKEL